MYVPSSPYLSRLITKIAIFATVKKSDEDSRGVKKARENVVYDGNLGKGIDHQFVK